jgi:hypothetical protein
MALLEVHADLTRLVEVLTRIANKLDALSEAIRGPLPDMGGPPPDGGLSYVTEEQRAERAWMELKERMGTFSPGQDDT